MQKIIHYFYDDIEIWKKNKAASFRMCYASWVKHCPDYEIKLWHTEMPEFKQMLRESAFLRECYQRKMFAFMADYVRYYALYHYGGVYLDTDVQLVKNFDEYLDKSFFFSIEGDVLNGENIPEPAIMGAPKGHELVKETLDFYNSKDIFNVDYPIANVILKKILKSRCNFSRINYNESYAEKAEGYYDRKVFCTQIKDYELYRNQKIFEDSINCVKVYPSEYFCPTWDTFEDKAFTDKTVSIHWNQSSWWKDMPNLKEIQSLRFDSKFKRILYLNAKSIAKALTFYIPNKKIRHKLRDKIQKRLET